MQPTSLPVPLSRMTSVREAFRLRRVAHAQCRLWQFYLEHNLFDEARRARGAALANLSKACRQWRILLGTSG